MVYTDNINRAMERDFMSWVLPYKEVDSAIIKTFTYNYIHVNI